MQVYWFGHLSSGVDPIVSSHTQLSRHFTGCTKKSKITNRRWKEKKSKYEFRTVKHKKVKFGTFWHSIYLWLMLQLGENSTQVPKMLTHL